MRRPSLCSVAVLLLLCSTALTRAQTAPPAAGTDPVVARVAGEDIHATELADAAQTLPEELRGMPPTMLYPMLLDQLVDRRVIVLAARKQGFGEDAAVKRAVVRATDTALQNALLTREIAPMLTDEAIKARYERDIAGKPGEEEVRASHILVADEEKAKAIIAQLKGGASFAEVAKTNSTDPSAAQNNGDLGFFKKTDMLPEFSDAAFALQPGQITETPVKTRFGLHVIKLEERRTAPPAALDQVRDEIRQSLIQEGVSRVLAQAKTGIAIEKFNQDGTLQTAAPPTPMPTPAK